MTSFQEALERTQILMNKALKDLIESLDPKGTRLIEAMAYALLNGGKRIRPFFCLSIGEMLNGNPESLIKIACAIELLHTYSLIHDDLPAMDNADLRRGKPSCHVRFDEATAILAGDAMMAYAFEILSDSKLHPEAQVQCQLVKSLAQASGPQGMALGQMMDIQWEDQDLSRDALSQMNQFKTSALIEFSCLAPVILKKAEPRLYTLIQSYSEKVGLLFQLVDDILDSEGQEDMLGKPTGQNKTLHKSTFVSLLGLEQAKREAENLHKKALEDLENLNHMGFSTEILIQATHFILKRQV